MKTCLTLSLSLILTTAAHGQGTFVLWDESVNGLLSQSSSTPTSLVPLRVGMNSIIGTTDVVPTGGNWSLHPDFFSFTVPSEFAISTVHIQVNKPNVWTWIGDPTFLNEVAFAASPLSGDLSSQLGIGAIGPGVYGMYMENHDLQPFSSTADYRLDFVVVPEPNVLGLVILGGAALFGFGRRLR